MIYGVAHVQRQLENVRTLADNLPSQVTVGGNKCLRFRRDSDARSGHEIDLTPQR